MGINSKVTGSRRGVGTVANQSHSGTEMLRISPRYWSAGRSRTIMRYSERTRITVHLSVLVPAIPHFLSWGACKSAGCASQYPTTLPITSLRRFLFPEPRVPKCSSPRPREPGELSEMFAMPGAQVNRLKVEMGQRILANKSLSTCPCTLP